MPRKSKARKPVKRHRRMRGGYLSSSLGENNLNALNQISIGENNLNAIKQLEMPKPPLQPTGQVVNIPFVPHYPAAIPYPVTGTVPFIDRVRGYLKRSKIISKTARALKANRIADFADQRGYGRRHRGGARYAVIDKYGVFQPAN